MLLHCALKGEHTTRRTPKDGLLLVSSCNKDTRERKLCSDDSRCTTDEGRKSQVPEEAENA